MKANIHEPSFAGKKECVPENRTYTDILQKSRYGKVLCHKSEIQTKRECLYIQVVFNFRP